MKAKLTKLKFRSACGRVGQFCSMIALAAAISTCASASAQNMFVSGTMPPKNCWGGCGVVYKFTWDGGQSIFAVGLTDPWDVAFDSAGNLFVVGYDRSGFLGDANIYKITSNGARTLFASGLRYPSYLAADAAGNVFASDYNRGIIYKYKPTGSRGIFASGLHHPVGMTFNSLGNLFVVDNNIGDIYQGSIYEYKPDGSRTRFALLEASDQPADLAFDATGNLFVGDLGGNIYRYSAGVPLRPHSRTTFGSVPGSAQSLAFDGAGNLFVVDGGEAHGTSRANAIYKFTHQGLGSTFVSGQTLGESFACLAFQPMACCQ